MMPDRIRLSRQKGWRMPENTVKVDRSTRYGNPFITGTHGTRLECTGFYTLMIDGTFVVAKTIEFDAIEASYAAIRDGAANLRGKNLACWCSLPTDGEPDTCHARVMLEFINHAPKVGSHTDRIIHAWRSSKTRASVFISADYLKLHPKNL